MKLFLIILTMSFIIEAAVSTDVIALENTTVQIKCTEMSCAGCKKKIKTAIEAVDGVFKADVNLETKVITVTYDDQKTTPDKIIGAIAEVGYDAELIK